MSRSIVVPERPIPTMKMGSERRSGLKKCPSLRGAVMEVTI
jgi:hypothetical protein